MRVGALILAMSLTLGAVSARAQDHTARDEAQYRQLIEEAISEFGASRFPEARALFQRAHAISPNARTLRGIGMTSFELRDYVEAYRALSGALVQTARALTPEQSTEVRSLLERSARFLGIYRVTITPESAGLTADGAPPVLAADGRVLLDLGRHELVARAAGLADARVSVEVRGGEDDDVSLALAPTETSARPAVDLAVRVEPSASVPGEADPTFAIVLVAAGGTAAVASVIVGLASWLTREDEIQVCDSFGDRCENGADLRSERDLAAGLTIGLGAAGAGTMIAGAIVLSRGSGSGDVVACAPAGPGLACHARF